MNFLVFPYSQLKQFKRTVINRPYFITSLLIKNFKESRNPKDLRIQDPKFLTCEQPRNGSSQSTRRQSSASSGRAQSHPRRDTRSRGRHPEPARQNQGQ